MRESPVVIAILILGGCGALIAALSMSERPKPAPPVPATWTAKEEPKPAPPTPPAPVATARTVELVYGGEHLARFQERLHGFVIASPDLAAALTPGDDGPETVVMRVWAVPVDPPGSFRVASVAVLVTSLKTAPTARPVCTLVPRDKDYRAVWDVIQVDAVLALQEVFGTPPKADPPAPKKEPTCACAYCGCCSRTKPRDCTCGEAKCKEAGCACGKWKKPEPDKKNP